MATVYRPQHQIQSDSDALVDAQRQAAGLPPLEKKKDPKARRNETATDEFVMERFKKRIRKN